MRDRHSAVAISHRARERGTEMLRPSELRTYKDARKAGYSPAVSLYVVRPPAVTLDSDPNAIAWDAGTFTYNGVTYDYRIEWAEGDCFCWEEAVPAYREHGDDVDAAGMVTISPEEAEGMEHRNLAVSIADADDWVYLGSVCGDRRTYFGRLLDDRYLADTLVEMTHEAITQHESTKGIGSNQLTIEGVI